MAASDIRTAVTHDGTFHADDVFAGAMLQFAFPGIEIARTRDEGRIAAADIVFDVGGRHSDEGLRFDHHMREGPRRPDGVPYSSVGLVWRAFGRGVMERFQTFEAMGRERRGDDPRAPLDAASIERAWAAVDGGLVRCIDMSDNGQLDVAASDIASLIGDLAPKHVASPPEMDEAYFAAVDIARTFLSGTCRKALRNERDRLWVRGFWDISSPDVLVLPQPAAWERAVFEEGLPVKFVVFPDGDSGNWICRGVPTSPGVFDVRVPLPEEWRGLRGEALSDAVGMDGCVFCHHAGFICGHSTREGAVELARMAIAASPSPGLGG